MYLDTILYWLALINAFFMLFLYIVQYSGKIPKIIIVTLLFHCAAWFLWIDFVSFFHCLNAVSSEDDSIELGMDLLAHAPEDIELDDQIVTFESSEKPFVPAYALRIHKEDM